MSLIVQKSYHSVVGLTEKNLSKLEKIAKMVFTQ